MKPPMPPVTTGRNAAIIPPRNPAKPPLDQMPVGRSALRQTYCGGISVLEKILPITHGMAKSPTKTGMIFWKAYRIGTSGLLRTMKPRMPERRKVRSPAARFFHPSMNRPHPVFCLPLPFGHSLRSM